MRTALFVNCPKCGNPFRFKIDAVNNGWVETEPSLECKCGCKVMLKIRVDTLVEPKQ